MGFPRGIRAKGAVSPGFQGIADAQAFLVTLVQFKRGEVFLRARVR